MSLFSIKRKYLASMFSKENVIGMGIGKKVSSNKRTGEDSIIVLVSRKKPRDQLSPHSLVPQTVDGVKTDVIEVGEIKALPKPKMTAKSAVNHTSKWRPAVGGISIGHKDITAGTLGSIVYKDGEPYILSNNHVLANSNAASIGDPVLQPAPYDGGKMDEQIATLHSYVPITFGVSGTSCPYAHTAEDIMNLITKLIKPNYEWELKKLNDGVNYVDCALAKPLYPGLLNNLILEVGVIKGTAQAFIGMKVRKSGRTTGYTKGEVLVLDTTVTVDYGFGKAAVFENQIIAGAMSRGGDSGSLVLDENNNAVGLLFAGSDEVTILNPIEHVTSALGISLTL